MASLFPKRRFTKWYGATDDDETKSKTEAILSYMMYVIDYPGFKDTISQLVLDYIDYGNVFVTPDWLDQTVAGDTQIQTGYVGPIARRISPWDIVMDPTAPDFYRSPKIVRSLVSLGDLEDILQAVTTNDGERETAQKLYTYLKDIRMRVTSFEGDLSVPDDFYQVDGFTSFRNYLESGYAEILTFYGDLYERETGNFYKNYIIQVVDRHKIVRMEPNPSKTAVVPIFHAGWRPRQDNLWAMGPLENLVGLQYRLDHIENLKSDFFDLIYAPPLKIKGYVENFEWKPFEKIYVGDEGDVEVIASNINPLQANFELDRLQATMEELAGAPKEAMGFRTPGEKTAYEVQRLENAASRIFQNKISRFEEQVLEPLLNAMLELARRKMNTTTVRVLDDEYNTAFFMDIQPEDIAGAGRIRPMAARHFAEVAERVQTITQFYSSGIGMDEMVRNHLSSIGLAKLFEDLLDLEEYHLVQENIRITEASDAQNLANQHQEDSMMQTMTPSGLTPEDADQSFL